MHEHDEQTDHHDHDHDRELPRKMLVLEITVPDFDADEAIEELGEDATGTALRDYLGVVANDIMVTFRSYDDDECENCGERHEHLQSYGGDLVRVRVSDTDWIIQTADEP